MTFALEKGGERLPYFFHPHNCGLPGSPRRTERTVELAIADRWLAASGSQPVVELGAVTPYYWPNRVARVVDPVDAKATDRASLFDVDLEGVDVLSISTIEHVGERRYGLAESRTPLEAWRRVVEGAGRFLVTIPAGWRTTGAAELERHLFQERLRLKRDGIAVHVLSRGQDERWRPTSVRLPYGDRSLSWANSVIVLSRD